MLLIWLLAFAMPAAAVDLSCKGPQQGPASTSLMQFRRDHVRKLSSSASVAKRIDNPIDPDDLDIDAASCSIIGCGTSVDVCSCLSSCTRYGWCCHDYYNECQNQLTCWTNGLDGTDDSGEIRTGKYVGRRRLWEPAVARKRCVFPFQYEGVIYKGCTGQGYATAQAVLSDVLGISNDSDFWRGSFDAFDNNALGDKFDFWSKDLTKKNQWCGTSCGISAVDGSEASAVTIKQLLKRLSGTLEPDCKKECDSRAECNCYEFTDEYEDSATTCDLFTAPPLGSPGRETDRWGQCDSETPCYARNQNTGGSCGTRRRRCSLFSVPPCSNNSCSRMRGDVHCDEDDGYCKCSNMNEIVTHYHFPIPNFGKCSPALPPPEAEALNPTLLESKIAFVGNSFMGFDSAATPPTYLPAMWDELVTKGLAGKRRIQSWLYHGGCTYTKHLSEGKKDSSKQAGVFGASAVALGDTYGFIYMGDLSSRPGTWAQDGSLSPAVSNHADYKASLTALPELDKMFITVGAKFVMHMTWGYHPTSGFPSSKGVAAPNTDFCTHADNIMRGVDYYAQHLDTTSTVAGRTALVSPIGVAWRFMHHLNPTLWSSSYHTDWFHCDKDGFYLMAAVVYGVLSGQDPTELPETVANAAEYHKYAKKALELCGNYGPASTRKNCYEEVQKLVASGELPKAPC